MKQLLTIIATMLVCSLFVESVLAQNPPGPPAGTKSFYITVFLDGLYQVPSNQMRKAMDHDGTSNFPRYQGSIADVITVELHTPGSYGTPAFSHANVNLNQNGTAVAYLPETGIFYLTIKHRNHIETASATTINLSVTNSYNFSDAASKAFGNNQKQLTSGVWGIFAGDINQDDFVNVADRDLTNSAFNSSLIGYITQDANGDGFVNIADRDITNAGFYSSVQAIKPQ